jgi:hypothetical protein
MIEEINNKEIEEFESQFQGLIHSLGDVPEPSEERLKKIRDRVIKENFPNQNSNSNLRDARLETQETRLEAHDKRFKTQDSRQIDKINISGNFFTKLWGRSRNLVITSISLVLFSSIAYISYLVINHYAKEEPDSSYQEKPGSIATTAADSLKKNSQPDTSSIAESNPAGKDNKIDRNTISDEQAEQEQIPRGTKITRKEIAFITIETAEHKDSRLVKAFKEIDNYFVRKGIPFDYKGEKLYTKWNYYKTLKPNSCLKMRIILYKEVRDNINGIVIKTESFSEDINENTRKMIMDINLNRFFDDLQKEIIIVFKGQPTLK